METDERRDELVEAGGVRRKRNELKPQPKLVTAVRMPREAVALREATTDVSRGKTRHVRARHTQQSAVLNSRERRVEEDGRLTTHAGRSRPLDWFCRGAEQQLNVVGLRGDDAGFLSNSALCLISSTADGLTSLADDGPRHWVLWTTVFLWFDAKRNLNLSHTTTNTPPKKEPTHNPNEIDLAQPNTHFLHVFESTPPLFWKNGTSLCSLSFRLSIHATPHLFPCLT